jgi:hypothetical protein
VTIKGCDLRAVLGRVDAVRSRIFHYAVYSFSCYALVLETIRHPAAMAHALFWPGIIVAGVGVLHYAVKSLVKITARDALRQRVR